MASKKFRATTHNLHVIASPATAGRGNLIPCAPALRRRELRHGVRSHDVHGMVDRLDEDGEGAEVGSLCRT